MSFIHYRKSPLIAEHLHSGISISNQLYPPSPITGVSLLPFDTDYELTFYSKISIFFSGKTPGLERPSRIFGVLSWDLINFSLIHTVNKT